MTRIVLDQPTLEKLRHLREELEVCDESGRILAFLKPASSEIEVPFTDEELDRFEAKPGGRTLAEIMADLRRQP